MKVCCLYTLINDILFLKLVEIYITIFKSQQIKTSPYAPSPLNNPLRENKLSV